MRRPMVLALMFCLITPFAALAADAPDNTTAPRLATRPDVPSPGRGPLLAAADRESARLAVSPKRPPTEDAAQTSGQKRNWISRHPALFGTLVGAGAGAVAANRMENELFCSGGDEDCFFHGGGRTLVGAGFGAGIGALAGWIAGLGSK